MTDPTILLVKYDLFLDIMSMNELRLISSLGLVFERDMVAEPCVSFNGKKIVYFQDPFDKQAIFDHLIKKKVNGKRNIIDYERAKRMHWVKHFLENSFSNNGNGFWVFSYNNPSKGIRTYIYHKKHKFLVVLKPTANNEYILITAHLRFEDGITKIKDNYRNRLSMLH